MESRYVPGSQGDSYQGVFSLRSQPSGFAGIMMSACCIWRVTEVMELGSQRIQSKNQDSSASSIAQHLFRLMVCLPDLSNSLSLSFS